jgi:hypothetical protein
VTSRRPGRRSPASTPTGTPTPGRPDWRQAALSRIRRLILEADPGSVEERKWRRPTNPEGVPVWSHDGILCTGETYKSHVRLTFAEGASLPDPDGLFNSGFEGKVVRAIVIREGEEIDGERFKALIRAGAKRNAASVRR